MTNTLLEISGFSNGKPYDDLVPGKYEVRGRKGWRGYDHYYLDWDDWENGFVCFIHVGDKRITVETPNGTSSYRNLRGNLFAVEDHRYEIDLNFPFRFIEGYEERHPSISSSEDDISTEF